MSEDIHPMEELLAAGGQNDSADEVPTPEYAVRIAVSHIEQEVFVVRLNNDEYAVSLDDLEALLEQAEAKLDQDTEETEIDL
jgi:hypothetical protein